MKEVFVEDLPERRHRQCPMEEGAAARGEEMIRSYDKPVRVEIHIAAKRFLDLDLHT